MAERERERGLPEQFIYTIYYGIKGIYRRYFHGAKIAQIRISQDSSLSRLPLRHIHTFRLPIRERSPPLLSWFINDSHCISRVAKLWNPLRIRTRAGRSRRRPSCTSIGQAWGKEHVESGERNPVRSVSLDSSIGGFLGLPELSAEATGG